MSQTIQLLAGAPQEFYGVCNFLRILEAGAPLTLEFYDQGREVAEAVNVGEGYAEKFEVGTFDRVRLSSATDQEVQFVTRLGNSVLYDKSPVGDSNIVGSVPLALDAATLAAMVAMARPLAATGNYKATALINANVADTVFTAAANVNGAILLTAQMSGRDASGFARQAFIAKATAPANVLDGEVVLQSFAIASDTAASSGGQLQAAQFIPAGLGLFYITDLGLTAASPNMRSARYRLL